MAKDNPFYDEIEPKSYKPKQKKKQPVENVREVEEQVIAKPIPKPSENLQNQAEPLPRRIQNAGPNTFGKKPFLIAGVILGVFLIASTLISKVHLTTEPESAAVEGLSPLMVPVGDGYYAFVGNYSATLSAQGYYPKKVNFDVSIIGDNQFNFQLEKTPGHLQISITPQVPANVKVDGIAKGTAPLEVKDIPAGERIIEVTAEGYIPTTLTAVIMGMGKTQNLSVNLTKVAEPLLKLTTSPSQAGVNINNQFVGLTPLVYPLKANQQHKILVVKPGYKSVNRTVQLKPEEQKEISLTLQAVSKNKPPQRKRSRKSVESRLGLEFAMFKFQQKEVSYTKGRFQYTAVLTRPYALSKTEVTNRQYRFFDQTHSSGNYQGNDLNGENHPVVNVSWNDAALFSNWLSKEAGVKPFYIVQGGRVVGFDKNSSGYRLASEAEWMNALEKPVETRYLWGNQFEYIPEKSGNYADTSARDIVANTLERYNDGYIVSSPVGQFYPNRYDIYDIEGNVAEWLHDVFSVVRNDERIDPLGLPQGENHIIRGGSWKYGSRRMLSTSYRQYHSNQGKPEVGFRIARYLN